MSTLVVDTLTNQEPQLCKAWVNFNGTLADITSTMVGYNVSSITDNGTGDYTLNFTTSMSDSNYSVAGTARYPSSVNNFLITLGTSSGTGTYTSSNLQVNTATSSTSTRYDCSIVNVQVFGN